MKLKMEKKKRKNKKTILMFDDRLQLMSCTFVHRPSLQLSNT